VGVPEPATPGVGPDDALKRLSVDVMPITRQVTGLGVPPELVLGEGFDLGAELLEVMATSLG
jgi:hypothetical protein